MATSVNGDENIAMQEANSGDPEKVLQMVDKGFDAK